MPGQAERKVKGLKSALCWLWLSCHMRSLLRLDLWSLTDHGPPPAPYHFPGWQSSQLLTFRMTKVTYPGAHLNHSFKNIYKCPTGVQAKGTQLLIFLMEKDRKQANEQQKENMSDGVSARKRNKTRHSDKVPRRKVMRASSGYPRWVACRRRQWWGRFWNPKETRRQALWVSGDRVQSREKSKCKSPNARACLSWLRNITEAGEAGPEKTKRNNRNREQES